MSTKCECRSASFEVKEIRNSEFETGNTLDSFVASYVAERTRDFADHGLALADFGPERAAEMVRQWRASAVALFDADVRLEKQRGCAS